MVMEVSIGDYGRMVFEQMVKPPDGYDEPDHWASIRDEAAPLVRRLIAINEKMLGGGYRLYGYDEKKPSIQRILLAQEKLWGCKVKDLKVGDLVWFCEEPEMYVGQNDPVVVECRTAHGAMIESPEDGYFQRLSDDEQVLRAPPDWREKEELYSSSKYWLKQADKLGL